MKNFHIYWFSGTGNTLHLAEFAKKILCQHECKVTIHQISPELPSPELTQNDCLIIMFPVYGQGAPPFVWQWCRKLPQTDTILPVVVIDNMANCSGMVKAPFYRLLKLKGYTPLAIKELKMPGNYFFTSSQEKNRIIIKKGELELEQFLNALLEDKATWPHRPAFIAWFHLFTGIFFQLFARIIGKCFILKKSCTKCKQCITMCPVDNIYEKKDGSPGWKFHCEQCMRCIYYCPNKSITNLFKFICHRPMYRCENIATNKLKKESVKRRDEAIK